MRALRADAVIARRPQPPRAQRAGNLMARSACWPGRASDIESGYRICGWALLTRREFYEGGCTAWCGTRRGAAAPGLPRGQRVRGARADRDAHLTDAANHAVMMLARGIALLVAGVPCARSVPAALGAGGDPRVRAFVGAMLLQPVYLGNDSGQSYAHVAPARDLSGDTAGCHRLKPGRHMFPYGALPWLPAALLRPVLGDWAVTASMGAGVALLLVGVWRWLPRTASPLLTGAMLVNWQLWNGVLQFQLPTVWAFAFACLAAGSFDRGRPRSATALAACALIAHPIWARALAMTTAARTRRIALPVRRLVLRGDGGRLADLALPADALDGAHALGRGRPARRSRRNGSACCGGRGCCSGWGRCAAGRCRCCWWAWQSLRNVMRSNPQNLLQLLPSLLRPAGAPEVRYRVLVMNNEEDG
jgi:hypothetical protein